MAEEKVQLPRRRSGILFAEAIGIGLILMGILFFVFLQVNRGALELELQGTQEVTLEYGDAYQESGAIPVLRGSLFGKDGYHPNASVRICGEVNEGKLGKYILDYNVQYLWWKASVQRCVRVIDTECPVIELTPDPEGIRIIKGKYKDAGYRAFDNYDGEITDRVIRTVIGDSVRYGVTDSSGNPAIAERIMPPSEDTPPEIHLVGSEQIRAFVGEYREDPGFSAVDCFGTDITENTVVEDGVVWYQPGSYSIVYTVTDDYDNTTSVTREVIIEGREQKPEVTPDGKVIYLTFDDGPGPYTDQLLRVLRKYNVKATFFVVNSGYDEMMKRIVSEGHSIGIHSMSHDYDSIYSSPEAFFEDLQGMQEIIYEKTGVTTWLMRFPGGSSNTVSSFNKGIMSILTKAVEDAGYRYFDWNVDSDDAGGARKAETVLSNVTKGAARQKVSIVLQHDVHDYSVDAVEKIIRWGRENGYKFLPLSEDSPSMHHGVNN